jgi:AcrR family transcriptional regulator
MPRKTTPLESRKRPRQVRSRNTVDAILQASAYILSRDGYAGFTTNRVAERAGVNIASLYQYFPNKETLLAELLRKHSAETRAATLRILVAHRGKGLEAAVRTLVAAGIAAHTVDPALHRVLAAESRRLGTAAGGPDVDAEMMAAWRSMLEGVPRGRDPDLVIWVALTAAHAVIHEAIVERPEVAPEALGEELTRMIRPYLQST